MEVNPYEAPAVRDAQGSAGDQQAKTGLLDKTNPHATARSVLCWAAMCSTVATPLLFLFCKPLRDAWPLTMPLVVVLTALLGALVEWQVDDSDRDEPNDQ